MPKRNPSRTEWYARNQARIGSWFSEKCRGKWLVAAVLGCCCMTGAWADAHNLPLDGRWMTRLQVNGNVRMQDTQHGPNILRCLYTADGNITLSITGTFISELPGEGELYVYTTIFSDEDKWEVDGLNARRTIRLSEEPSAQQGSDTVVTIEGSFKAVQGNSSTSSLFTFVVWLAAPFQGVISTSGSRSYVQTYKNDPYFDGSGNVSYRTSALPHAQVTIKESSSFVVNPPSITTDSNGRARVEVMAPLGLPVNEHGFVTNLVEFTVRSDAQECLVRRGQSVPFAQVLEASGAMVMARQGQLINPFSINSGDYLRPNDVIQVGNMISGPGAFVRIRYSDNTVVMLRSENHQGMRAIVGESGRLRQISSLLSLHLTNLRQEISDDPRRFGRMIVYKTFGKLAGAVVPGGAKTKWVTENAVTHILERAVEPSYSGPRRHGVLAPGDEGEGASMVEVDFFTDGAFLVQNAGGAYRLSSPEGDQLIPAGGAVWGGVNGHPLTKVGTRLEFGSTDPEDLGLGLVPADGSLITTRHPTIRILFPGAAMDPVVPGSVSCRVNDIEASDLAVLDPTEAVLTLDHARALRPGENRIEVSVASVSGAWATLTHQVTFQQDPPSPSELVVARPGLESVALRWVATGHPLAVGYRVFRSTTSDTHGDLMNTDAAMRHTVWWDHSPQPTNFYRVAVELVDGQFTPTSAPVRSEVALLAPGLPEAPDDVRMESLQTGVRLDWTETAEAIGWRVERALDTGSWQDLLDGEALARPPFLDRSVVFGNRYRYRLTGLNADRIEGTPWVTPSVLASDPPPPPPQGLTARLDESVAHLRWDPVSVADLAEYQIYRWMGSGFVWVGSAEIDEPWFTEGPLPIGSHRWRVTSTDMAGQESQVGTELSLNRPPPATEASFSFGQESYTVAETEMAVRVTVIRRGDLSGPAAVRVVTSDEGQSAQSGKDFVPVGETLLFDAGQAACTLEIPIVADPASVVDRSFLVRITSVAMGGITGNPASASITIRNADTQGWPVISAGAAEAVVGQFFEHQLIALGGPATYGAPHLPAGLALDPTTGWIAGVPWWPTSGAVPVAITASNAQGTLHGILTLTIHAHEPGKAVWSYETVDASGDVGSQCALALDGSGRPWIAYQDAAADSLKLAHHNGTAWAIETVDANDRAGYYPDIQIDAQGRPHISYFALGRSMVRYATKPADQWHIEDVETGMGYPGTALALDTNGYPNISMMVPGAMHGVNPVLMSHNGTQWLRRVISPSTDQAGLYNSLAIDRTGRPHLSYNNQSRGQLQYATPGIPLWQIQTVDPSGSGVYTSLCVDDANLPHISYFNQLSGQLRYARRTASRWTLEAVDTSGRAGTHSSLALDAFSRPHISYRDELGGSLKYACQNGERWVIQTVDASGDTGYSSSLALNAAGEPFIAYHDFTRKTLMLARGLPPPSLDLFPVLSLLNGQGINWSVPVAGDDHSFSAVDLPPGLSMHPQLGILSGSPQQPGRFHSQIQVSNSVGSVSRTIEFMIQDTFAQWRQRHFALHLDQTFISGAAADPDDDGIVNGVEFALGTDPWVPDAGGWTTPQTEWLFGAEYLTLTSRLPDPPPAGVTYEWLGAEELGAWSSERAVGLGEERDPDTGERILVHRYALPVWTENQGYLLFRITAPSAP
jgi:hypothetical protein